MPTPIYRVAGQEVVDSLLLTGIGSGDSAPITISVSTGTGAKFALNTPSVLTISLTNETETGVSEVVETFVYSSVTTDSITLSARAQAGTIARAWPIGSKVQIRMSTLHLQSLQEILGNTEPAGYFWGGPATGSPAAPTYRPLVASDIPSLSSLGGGPVSIAQGGTGLNALTANNVILGNGASSPLFVAPGTSGNVLTSNGTTWISSAAPTGTAHNFLSATHPDTTPSAVARGAIVTGQGASPTWSKLVLGATNTVLRSNGTDALWAAVNLTSDTTGTLPVTSGGTGTATTVLGDTLYGSGTNTIAKLTGNTSTQKLLLSQTGDGINSAAPVWDNLDASDIPAHTHSGADINTGLVGVAVGGTAIGSYSTGDILYASGPFVLAALGGNVTTSREFLISSGNGTSALAPFYATLQGNDIPVFGASGTSHTKGGVPDPGGSAGTTKFLREDGTWVAPVGSGTVTSVGVDTTATPELTITGGPITSAGVFTYSWNSDSQNKFFATPSGSSGNPSLRVIANADLPTVAVTKGGTGLTSIASGKMLYASGSNTYAPLTLGSTLGITTGTIDVQPNTSNQQVVISKAGSTIGTRKQVNLIQGSNVTLTVADNGGTDSVDVTIAASSGGAATHNLLSATHPDTTPASVTRGALVTGQGGTPSWALLSIGVANRLLRSDGTDASWAQVALGTDVTGTLGTTLGGTGLNTYTLGDIAYASATNTLSKLSGNTTAAKQYLSQTGTGSVSAAPVWGAIVAGDLPTIPISGGGTGQTTATAAIDALLPSQTSNANKFLKTDGTNTSWATPSGSPYFQDSGASPTTAPTVTSSTDGLAIGSGAAASTGSRAIAIGDSYASGADAVAIANLDHSGTYGAQSARSFVVGKNNKVSGSGVGGGAAGGSICGGEANSIAITNNGNDAFIGGGNGNSIITGGYCTIAGGYFNTINGSADQSTVGGGNGNVSGGGVSTVAGGLSNTASAARTAIGGGEANIASGAYSNMPGGYNLLSRGWAQTVIGQYNTANPSTSNTSAYASTDPAFIIGNGTSGGARSNAFEMTFSGLLKIKQVGGGLQVATGTNATVGGATLSGGTVTVSTTAVTSNSLIFLTAQGSGSNQGALYVSARTANTSFTITSTNVLDSSSVAWFIVEGI